jgi:hypothetical protein
MRDTQLAHKEDAGIDHIDFDRGRQIGLHVSLHVETVSRERAYAWVTFSRKY